MLASITQIAECLKKLGYEELTSVQHESLKYLLKGNHVIIIAPTGSGKTEAAMFPIMLKISAEKAEPIAVIYITPLRALNRDLERRLKLISECFKLRVAVRHGDTPSNLRKYIAKDPPHILITTPESLNYILLDDTLREKLRNLEFVVIDEYREMLESKRGALLLTVLSLLEKIIKKQFVRVALTATLSNIELAIKMLSLSGDVTVIRDPSLRAFKIEVVNPTECASEECRLICSEIDNCKLAARINTILDLAKRYRHILVFTNTRTLAESLNYLLRRLSSIHKLVVEVHHGSLSRQHRESVERAFKERKVNVLVATSSLELGIDIGHVEHVVQYMSPRQAVRLIQRVGRSRHRIGEISEGTIIITENILHELEARILTLRAIRGDLEEEYVIEKPLDVLAYAIALYVALNPNGVPVNDLFEIIKKTPLYSNLEFDEYKRVIEFLSYTRVLNMHDEILKPTRKTKLYLYITSMIPSSREVNVIDISSDKRIGVLDEEYVVINISPGDGLILAGRPWRVLNYNEKDTKLYVEPVSLELTEAFIPHWEGENIPVEYTTASKVGEALRSIKAHIRGVNDFLSNATNEILEYIKDFSDDTITYVDYIEDFKIVIVGIFGGSRVNNAIRDIVRYVLRSYFPYIKFEIHSTPYAIVVRFIDPIDEHMVEYIVNTIRDLYKYVTPERIRQVAMSSNTLLWRIYQVGQRFGAIPPGMPISKRLLEAFIDTVIGDEALKEVLFRDYDVKSLRQLAERILEGSVKVIRRTYNTLQKHHTVILEYIEMPFIKELPTLDKTTYLEKLMRRRVLLVCIRCVFIFK